MVNNNGEKVTHTTFSFLDKKLSDATLSDLANTVTLLYVTKTLVTAAALILSKKKVIIAKEA